MTIPTQGQIIDRYQVTGTIGAGSMGDVIKAVDTDLKRTVAIKLLSEKHRGNEELEARFVREGRAVAAISHANVVQVFTTGTWDERPYIAMEFLTGTDLGSIVAEYGPMNSLDAARAALDSAHGLQAAYQAGLIHRDVKPANLVKLDSGQVKVTDFGLAKPVDPKNEPALTAMGVVVGTPDYIAPEQARGEAIDEKVDIYALGGTIYYLLVGKPPFRKGNPVDDKYLKVVARHLRDPAPNVLPIVPDADSELAHLQLRMMSKKPGARPSYAELTAELESIVVRLGGRAPTPVPPPSLQTAALESRPGPSAKTPYLGGNRQSTDVTRLADQVVQHSDHGDDAATHVHMRSQRHEPYGQGAPHQQGPPSYSHSSPSHSSPSHSSPSHSNHAESVRTPRGSRALVATTIVSALVFVIGLGLYLAGPLPSARSAPAEVAIDAAPVAVASPPDATPPPPEPPAGMLLVPATATNKAVFITKELVTHEEFAAMFPNKKKPTKKKSRAIRPVTGVDFAYAQAFARTKGARLPSPAELAAALALDDDETQEFATSGSLWEWVDDGTEGTQALRSTMNAAGETKRQRPRAHASIGFRLVMDL